MKKKPRSYSADFKQEAVRRMAQAATIIGMASSRRLYAVRFPNVRESGVTMRCSISTNKSERPQFSLHARSSREPRSSRQPPGLPGLIGRHRPTHRDFPSAWAGTLPRRRDSARKKFERILPLIRGLRDRKL